MIMLDTHIWIWWVDGNTRLSQAQRQHPEQFHRDPADQIIVATARIWDCSILSADSRILDYSHVNTLL